MSLKRSKDGKHPSVLRELSMCLSVVKGTENDIKAAIRLEDRYGLQGLEDRVRKEAEYHIQKLCSACARFLDETM